MLAVVEEFSQGPLLSVLGGNQGFSLIMNFEDFSEDPQQGKLQDFIAVRNSASGGPHRGAFGFGGGGAGGGN